MTCAACCNVASAPASEGHAGALQSVASTEHGFALYRIGDAVASRNVAAAMFDALRLCSVM